MRFVVFQEWNNLWYWEMHMGMQGVAAASPVGLNSRDEAVDMVRSVRRNARFAEVYDRAGNVLNVPQRQ